MVTFFDVKKFFSDKQIRWVSISVFVVLLISWAYVVISFLHIPDRIILHIDSSRHVDRVGTRGTLYGVVSIWTSTVCILMGMVYVVFKRYIILARLLAYGVLTTAILLLVYVWLLVVFNQ